MRKVFILNFLFFLARAQDAATISSSPASSTSVVSLTPAMSSSSVASYFSALATASPQQPNSDPSAGDVGSTASAGDSAAGASGPDTGGFQLSRGGVIAIIVVAVCVCIFGIVSSVLFYLAKKRSWEVRKTIRRSARRVATALTPRRSTFPKDVQDRRRSSRGLTKIEEVPDTPRIKNPDIEKGNGKMGSFELSEPPKKSKWTKKFGQ